MKLLKILQYFLFAVVLISIISCEDDEQERTVTEKEVPQAVFQAFNSAYPGATIKEYAEEIEEGEKFYEVSCEFEGRKIDAVYKPDGTVAAIEEIISAEDLPDNINEAISKEFQQFSLELIEKIEKEGKQLFEVKLLNIDNNKKYELLFSDDGKLIEKERIKEDEE